MSRAQLLTDEDVRQILRRHAKYEALIRCVACGGDGRLDNDGVCQACRDDLAKLYREVDGQ